MKTNMAPWGVLLCVCRVVLVVVVVAVVVVVVVVSKIYCQLE